MNNPEDITLGFSNQNLKILGGNTHITTCLSNATYVNYRAVLDTITRDKHIKVNKKDFLQKIDRLSAIYSIMESQTIRIEIAKEDITITADNDFLNNKGKEVIPIELQGQPMNIGFNGPILKLLLNTIEEEDPQIYYQDPNKMIFVETEKTFVSCMPFGLAN
ncbi:hypothetical protein [Maribacter sp.]|uniref:hypothetical protein n=1 Tax=Maribacter sp. TaxID=1897614 RepID=UPI0025C2C181|nr:hypothetical protein [Maribacter sp.]